MKIVCFLEGIFREDPARCAISRIPAFRVLSVPLSALILRKQETASL
jgi:hypothetical protein